MKIHSHYDNLKVSRDAPQEVIRAAYRTLCQKYHPDRRIDDPDADRVMKIINASYAVLSDPVQRKEHDDWLARKEREAAAAAAPTAPPRPNPATAQQANARPYRPSGAQTTREAQARSQARSSAWTSQARVDPRASHKRSRAASGFSLRKISLRSWAVIGVCAFFGYVAITESMTPWPFTRNTSGYDSPYGRHHRTDTDSDADSNRRALTAMSTAQAATSPWANDVSAASADGSSGHASFARPALGPNGLPWPSSAAYLDGMPVGAEGGHSSVTIDNSVNRFDVFGKLVYNASVFDQPVRHFFIPAGQTFTLVGVAPGNYDVRYQNLDDGGLYKSQGFDLTEQGGGNGTGIDATNVSVTLYAVPGKVKPTTIGRGDF